MHQNSEMANLTKNFLNSIGILSSTILEGVKESLFVSFNWTADRLENLSDERILQFKDLPIFLQKASHDFQEAASNTSKGISTATKNTKDAFQVALDSIDIADSYVEKTVFENKVISSIIGSSHDNLLSFSKINLSLRLNHEDVSVERVLFEYKKSEMKKAILYIPGLFCDEKLWIKTSEEDTGLGDTLYNEGFYPLYIRYNQGSHISDNGKSLFRLLEDIYAADPEIQLNILSYSQGGLVLRSALHFAKEANATFVKKLLKIVMVSCPNGGSYIEKIGFWAGILMQASPIWYLKIIGFVGNLRSDAIKDLSHGIIREVDWKKNNQIARYTSVMYFGELDELDVYQVYSFAANKDNHIVLFFGDGIIEKQSLESLDEILFSKFPNKEERMLVIYGANHYEIMNSEELFGFVKKTYLQNEVQ